MGYELHIEQDDQISIDEWKKIIEGISGARIDGSDIQAQNPNTGEIISIAGNKGNVSVLFRSKGFLGFGGSEEWHMSIFFREGRASFNGTATIEDKSNPVHLVATKIAKQLGARIVGDEGEEYHW